MLLRRYSFLLAASTFIIASSCGHDPSQVKVVDMGLGGESVGTATVGRNDTISEIAERYNLPMESIIAANGLKPPYMVHPNQRLRLPPPRTYKVRKGDTIYEISRLFSTTQTAIVRLNTIKKPYHIREGQVLRMPMPEQSLTLVSLRSTPQIPETAKVKALKKKAKIDPPVLSGNGEFSLPVRGDILSGYGPKEGGLHNDGINIAAALGTPVTAAQSGVGAYVGDAIEGYGNLILLRHDEGYITAYAHLNSVSVKRGDTLSQGQPIGTVGQTGSVTQPQLHFEIRKGTKALNPAVYLRS